MPIAQALGFAEAVRYLKKLGMENVHEHGKALTKKALDSLGKIRGLKLHCPQDEKKQGEIIVFGAKNIDPVDVAAAVDESRNIAIRSGFICAEPIVRSINQKGLARASFYLYNTQEEIRILAEETENIIASFKP